MAQIKKFQSGGKFYWGDQELTPEQIQDFSKWAASNSSKVGNVASAMLDAYRSGKTVTFDPVGRSVTGIDNFDAYSKRGNKEAQKANRRNSAVQWGALFNSDATQLQNQIYNVGDWIIPVKQVEPEKPKEKVKFDFTNELTLPYKKGNDGKYTYSDDYVASQIKDRFNDYATYLSDKDKYELILGTDLDDFEKYYTAQLMQGLKERFESGMLTDQDVKDIQRFGVIFGTPAVTVEQQAAQQQAAQEKADTVKKEIAETYNPTGWAEHGIIVGTDANGNITVSGDKYNPNVMYYLGDWSPITSGKYYRGLLYNNKFYTADEFANNEELYNLWNPARSMILANDWGTLTSDPRFNVFYGKDVPFKTYREGRNYVNTGTVKPSDYAQVFNIYNYANVPQGYTAIGYINSNATPDAFGFKPAKYIYANQEGIFGEYDTYTPRGYTYTKNSPYYQGDFMHDIIRGTDGNLYAVIKSVGSDPNNPMYQVLRRTDDGKKGLYFWRSANNKYRPIINENLYKDFLEGRLTDSQFEEMLGSKREQGITTAIHKLGGVLKHQYGGIAFATKDEDTKTTDISDYKVDYNTEDAIWNQIKSGDLTAADKTELAAIGADVAGALTSLIPGYGNIAGAGLGLVGTGTQFASDVRRDGLDWGDVGRGIAGVSLDVLGLVPIAGSSAKMVKVAKTIQRGANAIGKLFAITGFAAGAASLKNIVSGDFDISDIRNVATGLQSTVGLGRLGRSRYDKAKLLSEVNAKQIKTSGQPISNKKLSVKIDDKPVEVEITKADYKAKGITDKYSKENNKKLQDLIVEKVEAKFKSKNKDFKGLSKETKDEILSKVTIDGKPLESKSRFKLFGDESYVLDAPKDQTLETDIKKLLFKNYDWSLNSKFKSPFTGKLEGFEAESNAAKRALDELSVIRPELFGDTYKNGKNWTDVHIGRRMFRNPNKKPVVTSTAPEPVIIEPDGQYRLFKKGGKVIKAQYAIPNGFPKAPNLGEINRTKGQEASIAAQQNPGYELIDGVPYKMDIDPATVSANANTSLSVLIPNEWKQLPMKRAQERVKLVDTNYQPSIVEEHISESIPTPQKSNREFYGKNITPPSIGSNLFEHGLRFGKFGASTVFSNKVKDINQKTLRDAYTTSQLKPVSEHYSPFNTFGTDIIGAEQERRLRRFQPVTTDSTLANALQLEANDRADVARAQYMSQIAGQYATNAERNAELRRKYTQHRADIANKNAQMLGDLKLKLGAEDAQHTSRIAQSVENLFGEYQTLFAQDKATRSAFDQQMASAKLQKETFAKKQSIMDQIKKAYIAKNPTDTTYSGLTSTWMNENTPDLALQYQSAIPDSMTDIYGDMYNDQMNFSWNKIKPVKKHGGTLESNKSFVQLLNKLKHEI